jgi:hypothetical protein
VPLAQIRTRTIGLTPCLIEQLLMRLLSPVKEITPSLVAWQRFRDIIYHNVVAILQIPSE